MLYWYVQYFFFFISTQVFLSQGEIFLSCSNRKGVYNTSYCMSKILTQKAPNCQRFISQGEMSFTFGTLEGEGVCLPLSMTGRVITFS